MVRKQIIAVTTCINSEQMLKGKSLVYDQNLCWE